ncbi:MAG: hypothetical protein ABIK28_01115 [Planctomycetota bacterium]
MADDESERSSSVDPGASKLSQTQSAPVGRRRMRRFVGETRVRKRPPLQELAIHLFSTALILGIMHLDIQAVQSMSASYDNRTRFFTLLLTLCLPAIVYGAVQFFTRRASLLGLCGKSVLGMAILSFVPFSFEAIEILWFTPACFAFGYLVLRIRSQWRNHKQGVILPPVKDRKPGMEEADPSSRSRSAQSRQQNSGWFNSFYSYFRMKRY